MAKPITIEVSIIVRDEIEEVARRTHRSIAFIARRALAAGAPRATDEGGGPRVALVLRTDEDDPADLPSKLRAASRDRPLGAAVEAAWRASRARFFAWAEREEAAGTAEQSTLDAELRDASAADTTATRLIALAASEYPRVRQLVALHAATPAEVRTRLANDRERVVREAAVSRQPSAVSSGSGSDG